MMKEILITSSALILALLVIRRVFRNTLSRRFQYALWGLALVRLLVPVSFLPASEFSVLTAARPVEQAVEERVNLNRIFYFQPQGQVSREELEKRNIDPEDVPTPQDLFVLGESDPDNRFSTNWLVRDPEDGAVTRYAHMRVGWGFILDKVWKLGMVLMGGFFLLSNLGFYLKLRKNRRPYAVFFENGTRRVYLVPDGVIPSPCLFGWAIYMTPAVTGDEEKLRHVLCHEETHAQHWDPLWSLLRCVCLTVYWFDPLVWVAAACSRTDCELACDEGALKSLGEEERIPYGQTLLSLIPVKRVSNPMIAATTMTAGKRQLKDRVSRIAKKPRQIMAAALAVAALAVVVSACTFSRAGPESAFIPAPSQAPEEDALRPLTGEELRWFNEEFFNSSGSDKSRVHGVLGDGYQEYYNIRNQFINAAFNLYVKPEDIDLYQLFYCDGTMLTEDGEMNCPEYKMTAEEMDKILKRYTGLTLAQTNMVGLENFTYQNDTYYWAHGDTNYPGEIEILSGTRQGNTVKLYHHGWSSGSEWYCVTLKDAGGSGTRPYEGNESESGKLEESPYWFISNQTCEKPSIPTPFPTWEPEKTVSLTDLKPYATPAVTVEPHVGDFDNSYENRLENWDFDGHNVVVYRSTSGKVYAAIRQEDGTMNVFLTLPSDDCSLFFYNDLMGHSGFYIKYVGSAPVNDGKDSAYGAIYEYFYMDEGGVPVRLLRNPSSGSAQIDLNGDGQDELLGSGGFFFQREGQIYQALFTQQDNLWPGQIETVSLDPYGKYFTVRGYTEDYKEWTRYLYFDGESLLIYKNEKPTNDHMVVGADEGVPEAVVAKARDYVRRLYDEANLPATEWKLRNWGDGTVWDDWRLDYFTGPYTYSHGGATVEGWQFNYEIHTTTPENIVLAGGTYLTEDNWVSPGYPGCDTLFFEVKDGEYRFLDRNMIQESMDSYYVDGIVLSCMERRNVELTDGSTYPQLSFQKVLGHLTDFTDELRVQYDDGQGGGGAYLIDSQEGNGPYYQGQMRDNYVVWSWAQAPATEPQGPSVTLSTENWYEILRFWQDSGLVMYKQENRNPMWFEVTYDGDPAQDMYAYRSYPYYWARCWFDDAEVERFTSAALGDHGDGNYQEVALAYLTLYEEAAKRNASPGSSYACTYVKLENVEILEDMPETWFPADITGYPHFAFAYDVVFVPENENALNTLMAGNTGEYTGSDPDVPEGAFQYSRRGSMYLMDGHWHCAGVGTG